MSTNIRQDNLFAAEDFVSVYKSFKNVDFTSYDFDTIRSSLIEYIKIHYPEDFNDYIESSEFIAIIELLAYLGTSLAFRSDLNARENLLDTAERRESIIRLAKMINYQPKRNIAAHGLMKIDSVRTNEPVVDSNGNTLKDAPIYWNDANNVNWFDQFVTVVDASFNATNPFGKPSTSASIGGIPTDLYNLNSVTGRQVAYNLSVSINGDTVPLDIINPELSDTIDEKHPDPGNAFSLIYRNDSMGAGSNNNGFFVKFVQGKMEKIDQRFDFPEPNRIWSIAKEDINNSDVYVQEIDQEGGVVNKWLKVPSVTGSNVIYNSLNFEERNVYEVIGGLNDTVEVKFPDGTFGNVPTGLYRAWYRTSIGRKVVFRPEDASNLKITLPYYGKDNQQYKLTISFSLKYTVSNGAPAETNEQIKTRAPQVYYTQDRMVNAKDYNVFPLSYGNEIVKAKAVNRTHAGHSRYSTGTSDATGFHDGLTIISDDGALYNNDEKQIHKFNLTSDVGANVSFQATQQLEIFISNNKELENFYYNRYLPAAESDTQDGIVFATSLNSNSGEKSYWKTSPFSVKSTNGFFVKEYDPLTTNVEWPYKTDGGLDNHITIAQSFDNDYPAYKHIKEGASVTFANPNDASDTYTSSIRSISSGNTPGEPFNPLITDIGPIEFGSAIPDGWHASTVTPVFRTKFYEFEHDAITAKMAEKVEFSIKYNIKTDEWEIIETYINDDEYNYFDSRNNWLVRVRYFQGDGITNSYYEFVTRGLSTFFESVSSVRFYWNPEDIVRDSITGLPKYDTIEILSKVNQDKIGNKLKKGVLWDITGTVVQNDGHTETSKVKVSPSDVNFDGTPDLPNSFNTLVDANDEVVFRKFKDQGGYTKTAAWRTRWAPSQGVSWGNSVLRYNTDSDNNPYYQPDEFYLVFDYNNNTITNRGFNYIVGEKINNYESGATSLFTVGQSPNIIYVPTYEMLKLAADDAFSGLRDGIDNSEDAAMLLFLDNLNKEIDQGGVTFKVWSNGLFTDQYYRISVPDLSENRAGVDVVYDERPSVTSIKQDDIGVKYIPRYCDFIVPGLENYTVNYGAIRSEHSVYDYSLYIVPNKMVLDSFAAILTNELLGANNDKEILIENYVSLLSNGKVFKVGIPGYGAVYRNEYYTLNIEVDNQGNKYVEVNESDSYYGLNGISSMLNIDSSDLDDATRDSLHFKWSHYVDSQQRIDPGPTNIIDLTVLTESYYNDMVVWKNTKGSLASKPVAPTTEDLRVQFSDLNNYKSISDELSLKSGKFKILFGDHADDELKATFKVVKMASSKMSDSELKSNVIKAVDEYFSINNWNFGESFYFTELAAYIHSTLSRHLSSVVIVPSKEESEFGNLFEISCRPDELFMSTATVSDVEIISNLTNTNLRM